MKNRWNIPDIQLEYLLNNKNHRKFELGLKIGLKYL